MEIKIQDGDTINVPPYLKPIIKDTYITFKKQPFFKNGDVLILDRYHTNEPNIMFIYNGEKDKEGCYHYHILMHIDETIERYGRLKCDSSEFRHATIEEQCAFFEKLKQQKLKWNKEEYKLEYIRWRAKKNEKYYHLYSNLKVDSMTETGTWIDDEMYDSGNYFRTKELAQQCRLELLSTLRKFHEGIKE